MAEKNVAVATKGTARAKRGRKPAGGDPRDISNVWKQFKSTGDPELRNLLIERYLHLVRYIAERVLAKLPQNIELDDLTSAGIFGLMDAVNGFDLNRGVKFETYCTTRIRGAILDELRSLDWVPRIVRNKAHKVDIARHELEGRLGRTPSELEIRENMGVSAEEFQSLIMDSQPRTMTSLNEKTRDDQSRGDGTRMSVMPDKNSPDPEDELRKKEITEFMLKGVSRKERLILLLYYYEDLTMREIGSALNLSESRVCQLHSRIIARLRQQLAKHQRELLS